MTDPPLNLHARVAVTRRAVAAAVELREALVPVAIGPMRTVDDLDVSIVTCRVTGADLAALDHRLGAAAAAGHRATAGLFGDGVEFEVAWSSDGSRRVDMSGDAGELVDQRVADELRRAVSRGDAQSALLLLAGAVLDLEVVVKAPTEGARWVGSLELIANRLRDRRWASTLIQLTPSDELPAALLVQDAGDSLLLTPGLIVIGPDTTLPDDMEGHRPAQAQLDRQRAGYMPRPHMLLPSELVVTRPPTGPLEALGEVLTAAARAAAWYWLADRVEVTADRVIAGFNGVSVLEIELVPYGSGSAAAEVALMEWATATPEVTRADATQRAVTFAVRSTADLNGAATPVLRTARSLYELAVSGLVAEALSARRAARDSAVAAARSAAGSAREVAAKSIERALALVLAASVALFANAQKLLSDATSFAVILSLAVVAAAALVVALLVDLRSGNAILTAFDADVAVNRDSLSEDDIRATRNLAALSSARVDLRRARITAWIVYSAVTATVLAGGVAIVDAHSAAPRPAPPEATSTPSLTPPVSTPNPIPTHVIVSGQPRGRWLQGGVPRLRCAVLPWTQDRPASLTQAGFLRG